jgi:MYXO-CTERM domain-containing protein
VASAQGFRYETQLVVIEGGNAVLDQRYVFPLTVDAGFVEDLGVTATITASSNLYMHMEGDSDVFWPDPTGQGTVRQTIQPLPNGSEIAMDSEVSIDVDFGFSVDIFGIQGSYSFNLLSRQITFRPRVEGFEPFLLPSQQTRQLRVDADPTGGQFDLVFPIDLVSLFSPDILGISLVIEFHAIPQTYSIVRGMSLDTIHAGDRYRYGDPTFPVSVTLYENPGYMDLNTEYKVDTDTVIGYQLIGEGSIILNILGFEFPFTIRFLDYTLNLFTGSEEAIYETGAYTHPLPALDLPVPAVDFGTIEVGDAQVFTFPVSNEGEMPLDAIMELTEVPGGNGMPFSIAPAQVQAPAGGQDAAVITFRPEVKGEFVAKLKLFSSDPLQPAKEIPVRGVAVEPEDDFGNGGDEDDSIVDPGSSTLYTGCACASGGSNGGAWVAVGLIGLVGLRRRRS